MDETQEKFSKYLDLQKKLVELEASKEHLTKSLEK